MALVDQITSELRRITGDASHDVRYDPEIARMLNHEHAVVVCGTQCDGAVLLDLLKQMPAGAPAVEVRRAIEAGIKAMWPANLRHEPAGGIQIDPITGRVSYWKSDS